MLDQRRYLLASIIFHTLVLLALVLGVSFTAPLTVIENTNKMDVISAVVLGDTVKSNILPTQLTKPPDSRPVQQTLKTEPRPIVKPTSKMTVKKEAIALKKTEKKPKPVFKPEDLLDDLSKQHQKQKLAKQKKLKEHFNMLLKKQAEKTMRQPLVDDDIKLTGLALRQAHGIVDKYQALVKQTISEHWMIPPQTNRKLACTLMIRTAPDGTVLEVQVTKSSGDLALDSSARAAVLKSSPLPVPRDSASFEPFRRFALIMKPETIL